MSYVSFSGWIGSSSADNYSLTVVYDVALDTYFIQNIGGGNEGNDAIHALSGIVIIEGITYQFASTLYGGDGNDTLFAGAHGDSLYGDGDNDTLHGGSGNDRLDGGSGSDSIYGGSGNDTIYSGGVDVYGSPADVALDGGADTDTLNAANDLSGVSILNIEHLATSGASFTAAQLNGFTTVAVVNSAHGLGGIGITTSGSVGANFTVDSHGIFYGSNGADIIDLSGTGNSGGWSITAGYGDITGGNTVIGSQAADSIGASNGAGDTLSGGNGDDTIQGGAGNDTLNGGNDNDTLWGGGGSGDSDTLDGGAGNDVLRSGTGADSIYGGSGNDTIYSGGVDVYGSTADVALDGGADTDTLNAANDLSGVSILNIEHLVTSGASFTAAQLNGFTTVAVVNSAHGLGGIGITTSGSVGANFTVNSHGIFYGSNGADIIDLSGTGNSGGWSITAGYGDITGGNTVIGSQAADSIGASNGAGDTLSGGNGDDTIQGGAGNDTLNGGNDNDTLWGGGGSGDSDTLDGGAGNDVLRSGTGADSIYGGSGNDTIYSGGVDVYGSPADVILDGGADTDTLNAANDLSGVSILNIEHLVTSGASFTAAQLNGFTTAAITGGIGITTAGSVGTNFTADSHGFFFGSTGADTIDLSGTGNSGGWSISAGGGGDTTGGNTVTGSQAADTISASNGIGDTLNGGNGNDTIHGGAGNDTLNGGNDNDTLWGGGGSGDSDTLDGGAGNDVLRSGTGADSIYGGSGNDTIYSGGVDVYGSPADVILDGGADTDTLNAANDLSGVSILNIEHLVTSGASFTAAQLNGFTTAAITGGIGITTAGSVGTNFTADSHGFFFGSTGADTIDLSGTGNSGGWSISAGGGGDTTGGNTVTGSQAADTISASNGIGDTLNGGNGNDTIHGGAGNDTLNGGNDNDTLSGDAGSDNLKGDAGVDTLLGGDGNDTLNGGAGADILGGGAGDDIYIITDNQDTITEAVGEGTDTVITSQTYALAAGQEIERLQTNNQAALLGLGLIGNEFANRLTANAGNNTLNGGAGIDQMFGLGGNDTYYVDNAADVVGELVGGGTDQVLASVSYTLAGGQEIETLKTDNDAGLGAINLTGNEFNNSMTGNAGNNVLTGGLGADTMRGLGGNDSFVVDNAGDVVIELVGNGTDTVFASVTFALQSGQEIENLQTNNAAAVTAINLTGNNLNNIITGNAGNNTLNGGLGIDTLTGLGGNDLYIVDNAADVVVELVGGGTDTVSTIVSYTLQSGREIEVLQTGNAGGTDALVLTGNQLAQTIIGNAGNNTLYGKLGLDTLTGGNGLDSFVFDTTLGAANIDTITSFIVADDTILLASSIFTALGVGPLLAGAFNTGAAATQADDRIIYNSVTKGLLYDVDGAGGVGAVQFATLTNIGGILSAADFLIV